MRNFHRQAEQTGGTGRQALPDEREKDMMNFGKTALRGAAFAFAIFAVPMAAVPYTGQAFADATVKIVVNKTPITNDDIAKRVAFLKLQRQSGNLNEKAREQLVDEVLKREEIGRVKMSVSTDEVDAAFARFAGNNKMKPGQKHPSSGEHWVLYAPPCRQCKAGCKTPVPPLPPVPPPLSMQNSFGRTASSECFLDPEYSFLPMD